MLCATIMDAFVKMTSDHGQKLGINQLKITVYNMHSNCNHNTCRIVGSLIVITSSHSMKQAIGTAARENYRVLKEIYCL